MPKFNDIKTVLLIGSGAIVIGQACEFDYSGTQAAKTLKSQGFRVILINSNPATVMTDPEFADKTYIEPIREDVIARIIAQESVDAILPTMGGQTALNVAMSMYEKGMLEGVRFLGAAPQAIKKGEDRRAFKEAMQAIGMDLARSAYAYSVQEALTAVRQIGFPAIIRASYTLAGGGSGVAYNMEEFESLAANAIAASPIGEILIEESLLGWKEFEMEVVRDRRDNCIIVCSIENVDPMGVHTGDSITVAPALTLTDKEYQTMRDYSFAILRAIGVDTGGANVQFAVCPKTGRMVVIEMNPRVSRSSALASKATGYPIAKVATLLAVGYTLDEITNDITGTPASFEPSIDYIVTKIPRFTFEKFKGADSTLGTSMKSVGEVMAIGTNFKASLQKALCSLERDLSGFERLDVSTPELKKEIKRPNDRRILFVAQGFRQGLNLEEIYALSGIDRWFLNEIREIVELEQSVDRGVLDSAARLRELKIAGFSDAMLAKLINAKDLENAKDPSAAQDPSRAKDLSDEDLFLARMRLGVDYEFNEVDTCAGEFLARTPYLYSSIPFSAGDLGFSKDPSAGQDLGSARDHIAGQDPKSAGDLKKAKDLKASLDLRSSADPIAAQDPSRARVLFSAAQIQALQNKTADAGGASTGEKTAQEQNQSVLIIGSGPNRIGQGIEFDYACVHCCFALRSLGLKTIMYNCNPETVSTDYDTSDALYFEPIDFEHVLEVLRREKPGGVIVQFGGQTPLKLAARLTAAGVNIIGTSADTIDLAEDRERFCEFVRRNELRQPPSKTVTKAQDAQAAAAAVGYPVLVRPSYVLGGRGMRIVYDERELADYLKSGAQVSASAPLLIDKFLVNAVEIDVDAICDGRSVYVAGVMQHIEEAGVHSGDSACSLPPVSLAPAVLADLKSQTHKIALELGVVGLLNIQFAVLGDEIYVLEVNPRASRTVPFVSKATGIPCAKVAARVMCGDDLLSALKFYDRRGAVTKEGAYYTPAASTVVAVKEAVFPFAKLVGADVILGPEMKSTGEVMGLSKSFGLSFLKAQAAAGNEIKPGGRVLLSLTQADKKHAVAIAKGFMRFGFEVLATRGTALVLKNAGVACKEELKLSEGRPHIGDSIKNKEIDLVVNTSDSHASKEDARLIRQEVLRARLPYFTTVAAAFACINALGELDGRALETPCALQDYLYE